MSLPRIVSRDEWLVARKQLLTGPAARAEAAVDVGGSNLLGEFTPDYDYALVRRFREAGFALVGKTQTPEYVPAGAALTPRRSRGDRLRG